MKYVRSFWSEFGFRDSKSVYWGLGRRRRGGQVVYGVRHSVYADHGAQFSQIVPGMPRARQVGKYPLQIMYGIILLFFFLFC